MLLSGISVSLSRAQSNEKNVLLRGLKKRKQSDFSVAKKGLKTLRRRRYAAGRCAMKAAL